MTAPAATASSARVRRRTLGLLLGAAALLVFSALSLLLGSRSVAVPDVVAGLTTWPATDIAQAAVQTRIPRTVLGLLVGAALALAGAVLQGATRNPLADPALLGVSNGAALAVVLGIAVAGAGTAASHVPWALGGAAVASVVVYGIASLGREGATPLKLALAGAATSAALSSLISAVLLSRTDVLDEFRFWQVGSIAGTDFAEMLPVLPVLVAGAVLALASARALDALALGEDLARGLGTRTWIARGLAGLAAVLLCGTATALAGPIGFLGLTMPHLARIFTGPDHRWLLPCSAVLGAALLLAADVLGRVVARPGDIEVGIMTAVLGAPVFVAIVRRRRVREL